MIKIIFCEVDKVKINNHNCNPNLFASEHGDTG